jgi:hypothetical protein
MNPRTAGKVPLARFRALASSSGPAFACLAEATGLHPYKNISHRYTKNAINHRMFDLNPAEGNALSPLLSLASEKVPLMTLSDTVLELLERLREPYTAFCFAHA